MRRFRGLDKREIISGSERGEEEDQDEQEEEEENFSFRGGVIGTIMCNIFSCLKDDDDDHLRCSLLK